MSARSLSAAGALLAATVLSACRSTPPGDVSVAPKPDSAPPALAPRHDAAAAAAVQPGPSRDPSRPAREYAVLALLAGEPSAESLPEVATDPGQVLDLRLRDRLAPVRQPVRAPGAR